ncbi:vitamin K epoxide reductase family protein [Corynebacterium bovis]|uniref:vitamin K epoxide reductase family protein n=1 Tax=Corynebacterium bovis TaxID=36808 RepID=UPI000F63D5E1|nr:vitamin K epoxide reductase family protein [Corynebacterium bovis]RRQ07546.1 vitamin K epoxide reductase [Corynebacterium bovis]RRQ10396.1 vitamin K epoxide reductase [Corynebacterium bovis]
MTAASTPGGDTAVTAVTAASGGPAPGTPSAARTAATGAPAGAPTGAVPAGRWGGSALYGVWITLLGAVGLIFSAVIMVEKIHMMQDSGFVPSCTVNSVIACGDVMASDQASAFGFPNPIIGLVGFPVVITVGMALLAGARFRPWFWWGFTAGLTLAVVFVHWLAYQAVYEIVALCPWCMIVWAVTLPLFVTTLVHVARERRRAAGEEPVRRNALPALVVLVWYLGFAALIIQQFGSDLFASS